jgi:hypothetical protein
MLTTTLTVSNGGEIYKVGHMVGHMVRNMVGHMVRHIVGHIVGHMVNVFKKWVYPHTLLGAPVLRKNRTHASARVSWSRAARRG